MKLLAELYDDTVIDTTIVRVDTTGFRVREAARAVVHDSDGKVALLYVGVHGYHKLPGGGIDPGEDKQQALARELLEEIGCHAEVNGEIGEIIENRQNQRMKQYSYCYRATQIGAKGRPDFTEKERSQQFAIVWADNLDAAIALLEQDTPTSYEGKFIQRRDMALLKATK